ncbi:hypothetical protein LepocDRAFT_00003410 [Leptothrix ochracea L12]|uniref:Uncharacterized protein n=1 Tax=Leptothrix ochracea L12 TaxID=735332 RepID=I4Z5W7_9BURK|nr:hypothetical protein LepocDRAFT_00003410 [Leptothrix ochracea L12]
MPQRHRGRRGEKGLIHQHGSMQRHADQPSKDDAAYLQHAVLTDSLNHTMDDAKTTADTGLRADVEGIGGTAWVMQAGG